MTPLPKNKTESKNEPLTRPKPPIVKRPAPSFVEPSSPQPSSVIVTDINMRFGSMVWFMVKWVIATIPALIILAAFAALMLAFIAQFGHTPKL